MTKPISIPAAPSEAEAETPYRRNTGRPPRTFRVVNWKVQVPETTAGPIELLLCNPLTGRPQYGARGALVTRLLDEWLARVRANPAELARYITFEGDDK
jgi:hypothetical protein